MRSELGDGKVENVRCKSGLRQSCRTTEFISVSVNKSKLATNFSQRQKYVFVLHGMLHNYKTHDLGDWNDQLSQNV
jgi:hypothetical protein